MNKTKRENVTSDVDTAAPSKVKMYHSFSTLTSRVYHLLLQTICSYIQTSYSQMK